jgi:hypothetical protein
VLEGMRALEANKLLPLGVVARSIQVRRSPLHHSAALVPNPVLAAPPRPPQSQLAP